MSLPDASPRPDRADRGIDPRGPRFGAAITSVLLLVGIFAALLGPSVTAGYASLSVGARVLDPGFLMLALVAGLFLWSLLSPRTQPVQALFRSAVQPRLAPPAEREDPRPPRFAQAVGLLVVGVGLLLALVGVPWALVIAGAAAFLAAALNAVVGFCLGCELYLLLSRAGVIRSTQHARS